MIISFKYVGRKILKLVYFIFFMYIKKITDILEYKYSILLIYHMGLKF